MRTSKGLCRRLIRWSSAESGWSYMELVVVVGIVAVIGTVAGMKMANDRESDVASAVGQMFVGDLALAQNLAMSTNKGVVFTFTPGTDVCDEDSEADDDDDRDDDDEGEGCGNRRHGHSCRGHGEGHNEDVRGEGMNGRGRGHGHGYGHAHNGCGDGCGGGAAGGYSLQFADGTEIPYPLAASVTNINSSVTIAPAATIFRFDSAGRLIVTGYDWSSGQTSLTLVTINNKVGIKVARETGAASLIKL